MNKKLTSWVVLEVIDAIEADFWLEIWLGHHQVALEGYLVKIYFQRKYVELYTKRKLLTREKQKNWLWLNLTPTYSANLRFFLIYN